MRRAFALFIVVLLFAGLVGGLGYFQFVFKPRMIRDIISKTPPPVPVVAVVDAKTETWATRVSAIGTLRAVAGIDIVSQIGGVIATLNFDRGQDVEKGAVLVQIDDSVERADLQSNLATLKNAEITLDRQKSLVVGGNTSRATLDQAQAARDTAAAAVERSKALIAQKTIAAPFAGRIGLRTGNTGQYVAPGASIANLQQLDPIFVDFPVPEQTLSSIKVGAALEVTVDAFPDAVFKGAVVAIDARVSSDTRNVLVRGELKNAARTLLPGMYASVSVTAGAPREVVTIPRTGVSFSLYGDTIFVVKRAPGEQTGTVERRVAHVGDARGDRVAVLDGLAAGETIVSEGQLKLQPGMSVRVDNASALPPPPSPRPKE